MPNLHLELKPSKTYWIFLNAIFALGMVFIITLQAPKLLIAVLIITIGFYYSYLMLAIQLRLQNSIQAITYQDNRWTLQLQNNELVYCNLQTSYVSRYLMVLRFRPIESTLKQFPFVKYYSCTIFKDSLKQANFRNILAFLRLL